MDAPFRPMALAAALITLALTPAARAALPAQVITLAGGGSGALTTSPQDPFAVGLAGLNQIGADYHGFVYGAVPGLEQIVRLTENTEVRDDGNSPQQRTIRGLTATYVPGGVAVSPGQLVTSDPAGNVLRNGNSGDVYAGTGTAGYVDDASANGTAQFSAPRALGPVYSGGTLGAVVIADDSTVRKVSITNFGLTGTPQVTRIAGDPNGAQLYFSGATASAVDLGANGPVRDVSSVNGDDVYVVTPSGTSGTVWYVTAGKIHALATGLTASALTTGFIYGTKTGEVRRAYVEGTSIPNAPSTIVDLDTPIDDVFVHDEGLFIASGGLIRFIPSTQILDLPGGRGAKEGEVLNRTTVKFDVGSWDENALIQCDLDYGADRPCYDAFDDLADGEHHFDAYAQMDALALQDQTAWAARNFYVDTQAPGAAAPAAPADAEHTSDTQPALNWAPAADIEKNNYASGIAEYRLVVDGAEVATAPASCAPSCSARPADALRSGSHSWRVRAIDRGGNSTLGPERTFVVDIPPAARLTVAPDRSLVGRPVTFDASTSDDGGSGITKYEWDLDGQPGYELETSTPTTSRSYDGPQSLTVGLRVTNGGGQQSEAMAALTVVAVAAPGGKPVGISINNGAQYTNTPKVTLFAVAPSFATQMFVSNDGGFGAAQTFPLSAQLAWTLDSSGPERLPKTVYVRYLSGGLSSETFTDDIILDETPPKVLSAQLAGRVGAARSSATAKTTLKVRATDNVSGVRGLQVTANRRKPGRLLAYKRSLRVKRAPKLFVRALDKAGNYSAWRSAKH